jgi:hypothetical protein
MKPHLPLEHGFDPGLDIPIARYRVAYEVPTFNHVGPQVERVGRIETVNQKRDVPEVVLPMICGDGQYWAIFPNQGLCAS